MEDFRPQVSSQVQRLKFLIKHYAKAIIIFLVVVFFLIPVITYLWFVRDLGDKNSIMNRNNSGVQLLDDKGEVFFTFYSPKEITFVPLSDISVNIQEAVVAAEDKDFYENRGFSPRGIGRAFVNNITSAAIKEGGSTITQQLVKTALLSSHRNFLRKYQELILALDIERRYSKEDILEMYLNTIYFGEGEFGIENAAQKYFGKKAKDLNLAESSMLVAILPAPSALSPISGDADRAKQRQEMVLSQMEEQGYITEKEKDAAVAATIRYAPQKEEEVNTIAPHFALMVRDYLIEEFGEEKITRNGYKVKTTLNREWQEYAQTTVLNRVNALARNKVTNGAAIVQDPKTGEIKVLVGSKEWSNDDFGKFNIAVANRQPGSSFKPIIYSRAIEDKDITAASLIDDKATSFGNYKPNNYDKKFRGPVTVRRSLANSLNIPSVKIMEQVGVKNGVDQAEKMGITTLDKKTDYGLPLVLGAGEVKLIELTGAYATLANKGEHKAPKFILEIKDKKGEDVDVDDPKSEADGIDEGAAFIISSILSDANARAEVFGSALNTSRNAAVKTGTTENFRDAWTMGYTPSVVVGVWVGNNDNTPMDNIAGSLGAAPIFTALMNRISGELPNESFSQPGSVVQKQICLEPGQIFNPSPNPSPSASPGLSALKEFFLKGTEPKECELPSPTPSPSPSASPSPSPTEQPQPSPSPSPSPIPPSPSPILSPSPLPSPLTP
ncbi:MAG: PBP1A family penicillin-binding protein [Candidatus Curtissbacteria bacterium]|nr:PBP1A family penicillin-binding protein [Candidatus Curtissbacteria bacterium]